jgi:hypothetical protein
VLPAGTTKEKALKIFRNHDTLIRLDPDLQTYEALPAEPSDTSQTKRYKVTDVMHALPAGLWDSSVSFNASLTDIENGVEWVIHAPMGLVQTSNWSVEEPNETDKGTEEETLEGRLMLVEDVVIKCSRLLIGTVRGKCEENWKGVHARWIAKLNELET